MGFTSPFLSDISLLKKCWIFLRSQPDKTSPIKMKLSNMVNKQIPYLYTNTALLMSYDWPFIFKRSWFARYMTVSVGVGVFAFFQMRKIEIAFHEKCKAKAAADGGH